MARRNPQNKNKNKQKQTKTKKYKKTKRNQRKKEKSRKTKKYSKMSFSVISQNFLFLGGCPKFPFLTTWPKKRAPPKHYKTRGFSKPFLKKTYASRNGHFRTKTTQIQQFQLSFVCLFSSLSTTKTQKCAETPIFIVF